MARLAAVRVPNEPRPTKFGPAADEQVPYAWMTSLLTALKAFKKQSDTWATHDLTGLIWSVVNEEFKTKHARTKFGSPCDRRRCNGGPSQRGGGGQLVMGGGVWHKALVVGSVSLWRRLLASHL